MSLSHVSRRLNTDTVQCFGLEKDGGPSELIKTLVSKAIESIPYVGETMAWTLGVIEQAWSLAEETISDEENKCMSVSQGRPMLFMHGTWCIYCDRNDKENAESKGDLITSIYSLSMKCTLPWRSLG